jgi:biotin-(acetyl-CoA carboxylase) ligase
MDEWRASLSTIGRRVRARTPVETVEGMALDVDGEGSLILRLDDGRVRTLPAAELTPFPGDPT